MRATEGHDNPLSLGCNDNLLWLGGGDKNLEGDLGNDRIVAGQGSDIAPGGAGNDGLIDGKLHETSEGSLSGGPGNDVIVASTCRCWRT